MDNAFREHFVGRYCAPFRDRRVQTDQERGLAQLERLVEVTPPAGAPTAAPAQGALNPPS
jgi:hypothetical protein